MTIMVCPLDWGLGHASRMIPVITRFKKDGHCVILAGTGRSGELLRTAFPELTFLTLPSPSIRLTEGRALTLGILLQIPGLICSVFSEHRLAKHYTGKYHIDIIVSDNRYGLFCKSVYTVFVTHQISPVLPGLFRWLEYPLYRIIRGIIGLYNECWIPDCQDPFYNLSGKLSHRYSLPKNARFIGLLSRFSLPGIATEDTSERHYNLAAVLSGPEPQISHFERLLCRQLLHFPKSAVIIRGMRVMENDLPALNPDKHTLISHLDTQSFANVLRHADCALIRSGYSGIMDMVVLGIRAVLIPTPGQSEQEYLASHLEKLGWFHVIRQDNLDLSALPENIEKPIAPELYQCLLQSGQWQFQDLYGKYSGNGKKAHHKA
jgi:hypothetical protein